MVRFRTISSFYVNTLYIVHEVYLLANSEKGDAVVFRSYRSVPMIPVISKPLYPSEPSDPSDPIDFETYRRESWIDTRGI